MLHGNAETGKMSLEGRQPVDSIFVERNCKMNDNIMFGIPRLTSSQKWRESTSGESSASDNESESSSDNDQVILFVMYNIWLGYINYEFSSTIIHIFFKE